MRVLFATSELAPLIKTGGLADVSAALPVALREQGVDVRVLLPGYPKVLAALPSLERVAVFNSLPAFPEARLLSGILPDGVPIFVIECPELFQRGGGPYQDEQGHDWIDNPVRFGLLSKIAAVLGSAESPLEWRPEVVHCNDWQTGLTPAYLNFAEEPAPCVITIHNLAFQGMFPAHTIMNVGLPWQCFQPSGVEFYGHLSYMKAGLNYSKHITTVSPSYANEIQSDELGFGLQGLLRSRSADLTGILNGIDNVEWNPAKDPHLTAPYDAEDLTGKAINKASLQQRMGLHIEPETPLFGLVSRFTNQKGLDLVLEIAPQLVASGAQLVFLGSGDADMQRRVLELVHQHSGSISAYVGFDEALSHQIEAGADLFLMPSRFEPCGLNQMYSQRYGTPPIVHATGGLIDSVVDCQPDTLASGQASGFVFYEMSAIELMRAAQRALKVYRKKPMWQAVQTNGMKKDFGWHKSAEMYQAIYARVIS
jgi:starch synthase